MKTRTGGSPPRQSPKKSSREMPHDRLQLKINECERKIQSVRDDIFKLQIELFQFSSPAKKAIAMPILQNIEKASQEYDLAQKKYDLSQNLVQTFQSIIDIYPIDKEKINKADKNKQLGSSSSNVVKPHIKQAVDFSKISPHKQKAHPNVSSRAKVQKKLELYSNRQFLRNVVSSDEREIRSKRDYIVLLEKDLCELERANNRLIQRFGTNSGFRVSSQLKYGQKINRILKSNLDSFRETYDELSEQIRHYETQISSMKYPSQYNRLIVEGQKFKEASAKKVNELLQEATERVKFGQKILASIDRIAALLDPNHLSSGISITELQWIMQKLSEILNKSITCSPSKTYDSIWDLTKTSTLKIFDDENSTASSMMNTSESGTFFPEIPEIPIMSMFPMDQSLGNTRQTRRLFSALNSLRSGNGKESGPDESLRTLGVLLGNVFVDRFAPIFHKNNFQISVAKPEPVFLPKPLTKTLDLNSLLMLYVKYKEDLNITQIEDYEIQCFDPDLLSFATEKKFFRENLKFSNEEFINFAVKSLIKSYKSLKSFERLSPKKPSVDDNENDFLVPCLWMIHDFASDESIPFLIQKLTPIFNKSKKFFIVSNPAEIVAWAALIASFFRLHQSSIKEALFSLFDPIFPVLLDKFIQSIIDTPQIKCNILALLRYGKHFSREFMNFINLKNNATSFLHNFIQWNIKFPTFVCAAVDFAKSALFLLKEESFTWHTSLFYHYLVNELMPSHVRLNIVKSFLSIMCLIVENRDKAMTLLLKRIYFIYFLKKNFELEEIVSENQDNPQNPFHKTPQKIIKQESSHDSEYSYIDEEEEEEEAKLDFEKENRAEDKDDGMPFVPPIFNSKNGINMPSVPPISMNNESAAKNNDEMPFVPPIFNNKNNNVMPHVPPISTNNANPNDNNEAPHVPPISASKENSNKGDEMPFVPPLFKNTNSATIGDNSSAPLVPPIATNKANSKNDNDAMPFVPPLFNKNNSVANGNENSTPFVPPIAANKPGRGEKDGNEGEMPIVPPIPTKITSPILSANEETSGDSNDEDYSSHLPIIPSISLSNSKNNISYNDLSNVSPIHLNLDNPKLQLHFQKTANDDAPIRLSVSFSNIDYKSQRSMYPIYLSLDIHVLFVKAMFATLVDHSLNRFDVVFCDPFPFVNRKPNILFTLMQHMESTANSDLKEALFDNSEEDDEDGQSELPQIPQINLLSAAQKVGSAHDNDLKEPQIKRVLLPPVSPGGNKNISLGKVPLKVGISTPKFYDQNDLLDPNGVNSTNHNNGGFTSFERLLSDSSRSRIEKKKKSQLNHVIAKRLMRLTMPCLFNKDNYMNGRHIASGAFGSVMVVKQRETQKYLAVKILKKSKNEYDNPHLFEVFTEVSILEMCQNDRRVTQLADYGCTSNSYYIIMEYYPTTLKAWRKANTNPDINVLLRLYREFLNSCTVLVDKHISHYDIKCDNVMVDDSGHPCLADFGESMCYTSDKNCVTMLNKGTEWIKSPEMLSIALNSTITNPDFDRRKKVGAGPESDVWSIGCLFYELITGEFLFADPNWSQFFRRITESDQTLILPENKDKLPNDPRFPAFLEFVLQRKFRSRPNLHQVISKFNEMFPEAGKTPLPKIEIPNFE